MYHVFICYPRTYLSQVSPLHDALELALRNIYQRDAEVFQDTTDLQAGNKWEGDVDTALEESRVMIVVVVPTILESPQCRREMLRFVDTPGKHIVPLICEKVPRLRQLADGIDAHPEGSEDHEIAVCAQALETWQTYDFSQAVYQNPNETSYKIAIAELARMIRNKLDHEDHATDPPPKRQPERAKPAKPEKPADDTATGNAVSDTVRERPGGGDGSTTSGTGTGDGRKSRRGLLVAALVAVVAAVGVGLWISQTPPEPVEKFDRVQARALLVRVLAEADNAADHLTFDAESGTLRIAAPPVGSVTTSVALQPGIDRLLKAGFVPGFTEESRDGTACFGIDGDPLMLTGNDLENGDFVTLQLRIYERAEAQTRKICVAPESSWRSVDARSATVDNGAIMAAPSDDARQFRTLRKGQVVPGPFWTNNDVPGWVRMEYRGNFAYLRRDLILELK